MPLTKLQSLGQYEDINGGAHRKAASIVGVPSLVRHIGLWDTRAADGAKTAGSAAAWEELRGGEFDAYLDRLEAVLETGVGGTVHCDADSIVPPLDAQVRSGTLRLVRFWWHGLRTTIRVEFRTEYVIVTSILDLSVRCDGRYQPRRADNPQAKARAALIELDGLFQIPEADRTDADRARFSSIAKLFQYGIWKEFEDEVLDADGPNGPILADRLGEVFADFRGIVTGSHDPLNEGTADEPRLRYSLRTPFQSILPRIRGKAVVYERPGKAWACQALRQLWPLVESEPYLRDYEFTVSGFLRRRALFITALGPRLPDDVPCGWNWTPVCNFIHAYMDDEWQIGRLVDRIMNLGTLRLAATMEVGSLSAAGAAVDELAAAVERANDVIGKSLEVTTGKEPAAPPASAPPPRWRVAWFGRKDLAGSADEAVPPSPPDSPPGGEIGAADEEMVEVKRLYGVINEKFSRDIFHRLERAQYYVDQFVAGTPALRSSRIEGFQKYDEIISRRMGGVFGYIRLLRARTDDVEAGMSALGRAYASLKTAEVTANIKGLMTTMNRQDREIEKIQEFGEFALIGALIPYYVGSVFNYAFAPQGLAKETVWVFTIAVCAGIALYRVRRKQRNFDQTRLANGLKEGQDHEETIAHLWWVRLLFIGYLVIVLGTFAGVLGKRWLQHGTLEPPAKVAAAEEAVHG